MKNYLFRGIVVLFCAAMVIGCATKPSIPSATLSKTRSIQVPELDGEVSISAIKYFDDRITLIVTAAQTHYVRTHDPNKKLVVLSTQIKDAKSNKEYNLNSIVLLDEEKQILPDALQYFRGNTVTGITWGVVERNSRQGLLFNVKRDGTYTINLIYAVDKDSIITKANIFGHIVEFETDMVDLDVINRFN